MTTKDHGVQVREKIRSAIIEYIQEHGYPPSHKEIGDMVGLKSTSSTYAHIQRMMREGMLETDADFQNPRAIRVPGYTFVTQEEKERLEPKEVIPYASSCDPSVHDIIDCPSCGETYWSEDWGDLNYCPKCGQAFKVKEESHG